MMPDEIVKRHGGDADDAMTPSPVHFNSQHTWVLPCSTQYRGDEDSTVTTRSIEIEKIRFHRSSWRLSTIDLSPAQHCFQRHLPQLMPLHRPENVLNIQSIDVEAAQAPDTDMTSCTRCHMRL